MSKTIIMYQTAVYAEKLRNQLHKTHQQYILCNKIIDDFNKGEQFNTDYDIIYSII